MDKGRLLTLENKYFLVFGNEICNALLISVLNSVHQKQLIMVSGFAKVGSQNLTKYQFSKSRFLTLNSPAICMNVEKIRFLLPRKQFATIQSIQSRPSTATASRTFLQYSIKIINSLAFFSCPPVQCAVLVTSMQINQTQNRTALTRQVPALD